MTAGNSLVNEASVFVYRFGSLGNPELVFHISCHICNLICDTAGSLFHFTERSAEEAIFICTCKGCQIGNQTDIRTFRCFNRTQPSIMAVVNISYIKRSSFSGETTGAKSGNTALMRQFRKRIGLIHKLGQRRRTEKFFDSRCYRSYIDQALRCNDVEILKCHTFTDYSFHT